MWIEQRRCLPEQRFERSSATGLGRLVFGCCWWLRQAGMSQEPHCKRGGDAETDHHPVHEGSTRDTVYLDGRDELLQLLLIHRNLPCRLADLWFFTSCEMPLRRARLS
jgi:hypothetical protein